MKRNNKRGFTLVEIIITLGLILLITGVAIGSFVGISKQKKKEEWSLVKGQIETAAEQYFSSNKYLFENIDTNSSVYAYITVGELVKENYIKRVVNPMNNKSLPYCSEIKVTFENGKFIGKYTGEKTSNTESDCKYTGGTTIIRTPDGPNGNIVYYRVGDIGLGSETSVDASTGWFNIKKLGEEKGLMVCVNLESGKNNIKSAVLNDGTSMTKYGDKYCIQADQGEHENKIFTLKDSLNRTLILSTSYKVDSFSPICSTNATVNSNPYNGEWTKETVDVVSNCDDLTSDCTQKSVTKHQTNSVSSSEGEYIKATNNFNDIAGNTSKTCPTVLVKVDKTNPTGSISISKKDTWYSKNVLLAFRAQDTLSGLNSYTVGGENKIAATDVGTINPWSRENVDYTLSGNYSDSDRTKTLTARICDVVGNCSDALSNTYTLYQQCSSTTDNGGIINKGTCNTCGATTTTATQPTIDNNLGVACSRQVTVSCTPSCSATSVAQNYCEDSGHRTIKNTDTNCCSSNVESDCGVNAIQLILNNNDAETGDPKGMGGSGPDSTNGGRIFNRPDNGNTTGAHTWTYSTSGKRGMNVTVGWNNGNLYYAGASCMNVGDFPRRFKYKVQWSDNTWSEYRYVSMPSNNTSNTDTKFTGRKTSLTVTLKEDTSKIVLRYGCSNDDNINVNGCGSSTGATPNVTTHTYYIEYGGIKSNRVTLYTKYFANCGY